MINRYLFHGLLIATAGLTVSVTSWLMQPPPQAESGRNAADGIAPHSGTVNANPFAKGEFVSPDRLPAQSPAANSNTFSVDQDGELVLDDGTRARLDMLVSGLPENATRHELQIVEASAIIGLPQQAVQKALRILNGYIQYYRAEAALSAGFSNQNGAGPEEMFAKIVALRRQHLGTDSADALFGAQEMLDRYGIQLALINADQELTVQQKLTRIDQLQGALPENAFAMNADIDESRSALVMEQSVSALRQQGASDDQVREFREQQLGAEAARNIGEMESQKTDWERRRQLFMHQHDLISRMNIDEPQKHQRVEALLSQLYSEQEISAARLYLQVQSRK